jgi:cytohesin
LEAVCALLEAGAAVDAAAQTGATPLDAARRHGHAGVAHALLGAGASPIHRMLAALTVTARRDDCAWAADLCAAGSACVSARAAAALWASLARAHRGPKQRTALMCAAARGDSVRAAWLLACGAPVEAQNVYGLAALAYASSASVARVLLEGGAEVDAAALDGSTALVNACLEGRADVARALLAAGAHVDAAGDDGASALLVAAQEGHVGVVCVLLAAGANAGLPDAYGFTPLHVAAQGGHAEAVRALLEAGAAVDAAAQTGATVVAWLAVGP